MTKYALIVGLLLIVVGAGIYYFDLEERRSITTFEECAAAGYPIMESYPEQCHVPGGQTFVRVISQ